MSYYCSLLAFSNMLLMARSSFDCKRFGAVVGVAVAIKSFDNCVGSGQSKACYSQKALDLADPEPGAEHIMAVLLSVAPAKALNAHW